MSLNEIFIKGFNENRSQIFRIKTVWEDGFFQLFVIESTNSWFALANTEHIKELAEQHELDPNIYFKNLQEHFSNGIDSSISFDITKKKFIMYRKIKTEKFRVKYFFIALEKLNHQETIETFMDELVTKYGEIMKKLEVAEEQRLESERQKLLYEEKCAELVEMKQKAAHKMYSAFTLILNEKKHRIQHLTEMLEEYTNEGNTRFNALLSRTSTNQNKKPSNKVKIEKNSTDESQPTTSKVNRKKVLVTISDSESSDGYNTDEEKKSKIHNEVTKAVTSTTPNDDLDFLGDSPPPRSLPKRIKKNKDTKEIDSLLDSPKKELKEKVKTTETKPEPMDVQETNFDNETQSLAFNTQELWDRM